MDTLRAASHRRRSCRGLHGHRRRDLYRGSSTNTASNGMGRKSESLARSRGRTGLAAIRTDKTPYRRGPDRGTACKVTAAPKKEAILADGREPPSWLRGGAKRRGL